MGYYPWIFKVCLLVAASICNRRAVIDKCSVIDTINDRTGAIEIAGTFSNAREAVDFIRHHTFDILFLDIEMPEMNGFELLKQVPDAHFDVIFTTAYDQFAVKAFRISAFDYLMKPISVVDLAKSIERWKGQVRTIPLNEHLDKLMELLSSPKSVPNKIALPTSDGLEFIEYKNIIRIESDSNYSTLYLQGTKEIVVCRTLKEMEELLADFNFIRIHHSHIINPDYLQRFVRQDGGYVVMTDGNVISVSRSRKEHFLNKFQGKNE